jgi:hypothetical protein
VGRQRDQEQRCVGGSVSETPDVGDRGRRPEPDAVQVDPDDTLTSEPDFARGQREGEVNESGEDLGDGPGASEPDAASMERGDFARGQRHEERDHS